MEMNNKRKNNTHKRDTVLGEESAKKKESWTIHRHTHTQDSIIKH
jgi:hypothetical protein